MNKPDYIMMSEAARALELSTGGVVLLVERGELSCVTAGTSRWRLFDRAEVEALAAHRKLTRPARRT